MIIMLHEDAEYLFEIGKTSRLKIVYHTFQYS